MTLKKYIHTSFCFYTKIIQQIATAKTNPFQKLENPLSHIKKLKDLKKTNYELGLYHLKQENYSDAIIRFKLIKILFWNSIEANFYLGKIYFLQQNFNKSYYYLNKYQQDNLHLEHKQESSDILCTIKNLTQSN